tara:strand:- start:68 stop:241 length:174 start_codon:yes stop_codon:yes gene_type:complete
MLTKAKTKENNKKLRDKRKEAIKWMIPHEPSNNGWWYYDMFRSDEINRHYIKPRKKR